MAKTRSNDVAELAGVSRSAVSRAFSKDASISRQTRDKVFEAAKKLGYRPNGIASSLAKRESPIVAIIANNTPDMREPYFYQTLISALQEQNRVPLIITVDTEDTGDTSLFNSLRFPLETAIVLADSIKCAVVSRFCEGRRPIVLNGNYGDTDQIDIIQVNERRGINGMLDYLQNTRRRSFWLISGRRSSVEFNRRRGALVQGIAEREMVLLDEDVGNYSYEEGIHAFQRLMQRGPLPDTLFCTNDAMAMGAMDAARSHYGLNVPDDVAVIGFDNIPQTSWPTYQLSTIAQPITELVDKILILIGREEPQAERQRLQVETTFIPRTSSRPRRT